MGIVVIDGKIVDAAKGRGHADFRTPKEIDVSRNITF